MNKRVLAQAAAIAAAVSVGGVAQAAQDPAAFVTTYCVGCHSERVKAGSLVFDGTDTARVGESSEMWEKVVRKLRAGLMPPVGRLRPDETTYNGFREWLEGELDHAAAQRLDPGRTETFHRLNRMEYGNAVRDLLDLELDVTSLLPADDSSYGFDNMAGVLRISPALMERYLDAAKKVSRMAVGSVLPTVDRSIYRAAPDAQQFDRGEGLPFGTRGGLLVRHLFSQDGDYEIVAEVDGSTAEENQIEVAIEGEQMMLVSIDPESPLARSYSSEPKTVSVRVPVTAGPRSVSVTFYKQPINLVQATRQPFPNPEVPFSMPPAGDMLYLASVTIVGPYDPMGPGDTPSRRRIFTCRPVSVDEEATCAKAILSRLARRAYRGTQTDSNVDMLLDFYRKGRADAGAFDDGIEFALRRLLVDPQFLFRIEPDPPRPDGNTPASASYRLGDLELAARLSFFLWSSIPDEELLDLAEQRRLRDPAVLEGQARRMLADPRASTLTENFAAQWLLLRNVADHRPAEPYARAFDDTLRQGFRRETELLFDSIIRENRSVMDLLTADYTYLNERLAEHYRIPNVHGTHFRRVTLAVDSPRRGLLGHGSILALTSYPTRTSPVLRGKYILNNILGTPPPDPPPERPGPCRGGDSDEGRDDARTDGAASIQSGVRVVPQHDRPGRIRAGKLR